MSKKTDTENELFEAPHELSPDEAQAVIKQTLTALGGTGRVPAPQGFIESLPENVQNALGDIARIFSFGSVKELLEQKDTEVEAILKRLFVIKQIDLARVCQLYKKVNVNAD